MEKDESSLEALLDDAPAAASPEPRAGQASEASKDMGEKQETSAPPAEAKADTAPGQDEPPHVPRKALEDERRKRQERDKEVEELQRQFHALQNQLRQQQQPPPQVQQPEPPDPYTDPEGWFAHKQQQLDAHYQRQIFDTRLATSERMMKSQHADFDDVVKTFVEDAQRDPRLISELHRHPFPAEFAYQYGQRVKFYREVGNDPEAYRQKVIADWQAQNGQGSPTPQMSHAPQAPAASVPKSLAGTPSAQPRDDKGRWQGPASLDDILGG